MAKVIHHTARNILLFTTIVCLVIPINSCGIIKKKENDIRPYISQSFSAPYTQLPEGFWEDKNTIYLVKGNYSYDSLQEIVNFEKEKKNESDIFSKNYNQCVKETVGGFLIFAPIACFIAVPVGLTVMTPIMSVMDNAQSDDNNLKLMDIYDEFYHALKKLHYSYTDLDVSKWVCEKNDDNECEDVILKVQKLKQQNVYFVIPNVFTRLYKGKLFVDMEIYVLKVLSGDLIYEDKFGMIISAYTEAESSNISNAMTYAASHLTERMKNYYKLKSPPNFYIKKSDARKDYLPVEFPFYSLEPKPNEYACCPSPERGLNPVLSWESFGSIKSADDTYKLKISNIAYDIVIFPDEDKRDYRYKHGYLPLPAYERRNLPNTIHRVRKTLKKCTDYIWSVRAVFLMNQKKKYTNWSVFRNGEFYRFKTSCNN